MSVIEAPRPVGGLRKKAFIYLDSKKIIPIIVPKDEGLMDAVLCAKAEHNCQSGLWILTFSWIEKKEIFLGKWIRGWFPPSWWKSQILELAQLHNGKWSGEDK